MFNIKNLLNKKVFKSVSSVFLLSTIAVVFSSLYVVGFLQGLNRGREENKELLASYLSENANKKETSSTIDPRPTMSPVPKTVTVRKVISWGGPDLWEAVNKRRKELGVNPLNTASELCTIASIRLNELLELGKLDGHEGFSNMPERRPDLKWIFEKYSNVAEFLAVGGETAEETVGLWENTLGHSKLLKGGEFVWGCIYAQNSFAVAITAF